MTCKMNLMLIKQSLELHAIKHAILCEDVDLDEGLIPKSIWTVEQPVDPITLLKEPYIQKPSIYLAPYNFTGELEQVVFGLKLVKLVYIWRTEDPNE